MKEEYTEHFYKTVQNRLTDLERDALDPLLVVDAVESVLLSKNSPARLVIGPFFNKLYAYIPTSVLDSLMQKFYMAGIKPRASKL